MFFKITKNLKLTRLKLVDFVSEKVDIILSNSKRISTLSMALKIATIGLFFAVVPLGTIPKNTTKFESNLKIDPQNLLKLETENKKVTIEIGESNFDKAEREKAIENLRKEVQVVSAVSYRDPEVFRPIYMDAGARFGIPWQLIEAVHEVESGKSGSTAKRSYAGAQGPMQFMPGTWRAYGVDGDGDGVTDVCNVVDAIYGGAHLLARSGADEGDIDGALFNYNHAMWYVEKVKKIAYEIGM